MVLIDLRKALDSLCHLSLHNKLTKENQIGNFEQDSPVVPNLSYLQTVMHGHCNIVVRTLNTTPPRTAGLNFRFPEVIKSRNSESDVDDTEISFVLDKGFEFIFIFTPSC